MRKYYIMKYYFYKCKLKVYSGCTTYRAIVTKTDDNGAEDVIGFAERDYADDGTEGFSIMTSVNGNCFEGDCDLLELAKNSNSKSNATMEFLGCYETLDAEDKLLHNFVESVKGKVW